MDAGFDATIRAVVVWIKNIIKVDDKSYHIKYLPSSMYAYRRPRVRVRSSEAALSSFSEEAGFFFLEKSTMRPPRLMEQSHAHVGDLGFVLRDAIYATQR